MNASYASILLAPLVQQFFTDRLMAQRNVSPRTVAAYRDTFRLLLTWFEQKLHKSPMQLVLPISMSHELRRSSITWKPNATTRFAPATPASSRCVPSSALQRAKSPPPRAPSRACSLYR